MAGSRSMLSFGELENPASETQIDSVSRMMLNLELYLTQSSLWPSTGRHILAQFDSDSVVVYQAFRANIADEAVRLGRFGSAFSRGRMSWIKPNFLWMMYRSGWATKEDQERVLAVRLKRDFFERVLGAAVASSFHAGAFASRDAWQAAVETSEVRLQWDPDHDPSGRPTERRAIQLGLRGRTLEEYAGEAIVTISDVTQLAADERRNASAPYSDLKTPSERVFVPSSDEAAALVGLDSPEAP
jgi:hypothetical protein